MKQKYWVIQKASTRLLLKLKNIELPISCFILFLYAIDNRPIEN